jgi:hypothetical protein
MDPNRPLLSNSNTLLLSWSNSTTSSFSNGWANWAWMGIAHANKLHIYSKYASFLRCVVLVADFILIGRTKIIWGSGICVFGAKWDGLKWSATEATLRWTVVNLLDWLLRTWKKGKAWGGQCPVWKLDWLKLQREGEGNQVKIISSHFI